jgi:microcystin-dependent protein
MSNQYIAEVRVFGFNFAPVDWAQCNGQTMDISQNTTLFTLIGTTYGGNGQTTFLLPNLQDLTAVGMGQGLGLRNWPLGATFGEANHTLLITEVPAHSHSVTVGAGVEFTQETRGRAYAPSSNGTLNSGTIGPYGGSQPHANVQPTLALNYCIALYGVFPPQS